MPAQYDFYKNPSPKNSKRRIRYHARVVPYGTTDTQTLAELIHSRCTVTPADVKAVLSSLCDTVVEELSKGNRVYIEGLGYLQITLQCPPIQSPKEIRSESIHFKSVAFRPEAGLKKRLKNTRFERSPYKNHSNEISDTRIDELLTSYFAVHPYLTRLDFQRLCGYTLSTANRRLKVLREKGKLINIGARLSPLYEAGEGWYGKGEKTSQDSYENTV